MAEHPILFSGPMIRAILEGRKTQTRRVIKPQPIAIVDGVPRMNHKSKTVPGYSIPVHEDIKCPYGTIGDRLWVRENWWKIPMASLDDMRNGADTWPRVSYPATDDEPQYIEWGWKKKPSIHMPRWASRITLEITDIRVQKLQEITEEDIKAEGFHNLTDIGWRYCFGSGWNHINEKRGYSWQSNPWVWAISFKRLK